ncbi:hypothetical protein JGUZn3_22040 [Entomobacter blattae]|uniref:Uncharacterized protein n=1 Tax=Entomobacter blattae TaxID=2762277 RepID=A0A7H1NUE5_9PROT|nr:hypothetical protein JGUZn3_22040 [Entomobacter blattae]
MMNTKEIIRAAGGPSKVARAVDRHHSTVCKWDFVPGKFVRIVSELSKIPPETIRPDIFQTTPTHEELQR